MFLLFFFFIFLFTGPVQAQTGLPLPRFVSLRSNQVNLRTGPGFRYPVEWVYLKSDLPVEITAEFETWRRIKDFNGKEGWIYQPMLSGRRTVRLKQESLLLRAASQNALPLAKIESGAVGRLMLCPAGVSRIRPFSRVDFQRPAVGRLSRRSVRMTKSARQHQRI